MIDPWKLLELAENPKVTKKMTGVFRFFLLGSLIFIFNGQGDIKAALQVQRVEFLNKIETSSEQLTRKIDKMEDKIDAGVEDRKTTLKEYNDWRIAIEKRVSFIEAFAGFLRGSDRGGNSGH